MSTHEAEVDDCTIAHLIGEGDEVYRVALPSWFEHRANRRAKWDERKGRMVVKTWRPVWEPLSANYRGHYRPKSDATATVRGYVAKEAGPKRMDLPCGEHLTVRLHYRPRTNVSRDGMNLAPLSKACVDGLARGPQKTRTVKVGKGPNARTVEVPIVGLDLVPDDTDEYVTELRPAILAHDPTDPGLWLDVIVHRPFRPAGA